MTRTTSAASFLRGMGKVMFIALAMNLFMTNLFEFLAGALDPGLDKQAGSMFSCVTCALLTLWLQADARGGFAFARTNGYVKAMREKSGDLEIAANCPQRWLVILHVELNPATVAARQG